jgi:hypothetical protein
MPKGDGVACPGAVVLARAGFPPAAGPGLGEPEHRFILQGLLAPQHGCQSQAVPVRRQAAGAHTRAGGRTSRAGLPKDTSAYGIHFPFHRP